MTIGNRNIFKIITPHYPSLLKFHIFLGIYGTLLVLIHPILQIYTYGSVLLFTFPDFANNFQKFISLGRIALLLFLVIWITSIFRKKMKYKWWLFIHYLSYVLVFFVFIHALGIGTYINHFPLIKAYWLVLFAIYGFVAVRRVIKIFTKPSLPKN